MVEVSGCVSEVAQVCATDDVEHSPQWLPWHAHHEPARRDPGHLAEHGIRIGHVLEHLERGGSLELVVRVWQRVPPSGLELEIGPAAKLPLLSQLWVLEVDADHAALGNARCPHLREHTFAAADV